MPDARNVGRFQYTGQMYIPELGLYYYKARMYSSRLGRFLQTDPVGYKDQMNLYAYVGNDPMDKTDPSGMYGDCTGTRLCSPVNAAITNARQTLTRSISSLTSLRDKEASGAKLSSADRRVAATVDKYLGKGTAENVGHLNTIIGAARAELSVINDKRLNGYRFTRSTDGSIATRMPYAGIDFHQGFFSLFPADRAATIANEAWHEATRRPDFGPYGGRQNAIENVSAYRGNFETLMRSHDNFNYAIGF